MTPPIRRQHLLTELALVTGTAGFILLILRASPGWIPAGAEHWVLPVFFLYAPLLAAGVTERHYRSIGLGQPVWTRALMDLALTAFLIFPLFLFSWGVLVKYGLGWRFQTELPSGMPNLILWQLLGVALPEEVFFRGWLQDRLTQLLPPRRRLYHANVGPALFLTAALFALAHYLVIPKLHQLLVFFPGVLFGVLRERSQSLLAPILAHALANISFLSAQGMAVR
jgi:membrane protease YdiL (CAAX protease family)